VAIEQRVWDTNVVLDYLSGNQAVQPACDLIIGQAEQGQLEIVVSVITEAEAAYLEGLSPSDSEARIREFFSRDYVVIAAFDSPIARLARRLIRDYKLKAADAVHLATAVRWHFSVLETRDPHLLRLTGKEGNPPVVIQEPTYRGPLPLFPPSPPNA